MTYLLDTNICSAHIRRPAGLAHRFFQHTGRLAISSIALAELYAWANLVPNAAKIFAAIRDLLGELTLLPFDGDCAEMFGKLRGDLQRAGFAMNPVDLQIASVALVHQLVLVTNNT